MDYLPLFLDLRQRLVLVVGGGEIAARKIDLLLQAQARVRLVTPTLIPELQALAQAGRLQHLAAEFSAEQFEDVVLAIAATDDPQVNRAVAQGGLERRLFVNVVDDQDASSCIMPSIVDRSPVIVAIGTSGSSPTLARRLRAQIEMLLPQRLGDLARLLGRIRPRVRQALPQLELRRRFWEQLLDGPVASQVYGGDIEGAEAAVQAQLAEQGSAPSRVGGEVYLIGAGPGDPDLLTLRAQQLLQRCDVVLYDRLVSDEVLARVRREALRVFVGKETGRHRVTQERIHALLLEYASRGLRVARLKGGDPLIFGRGGEEIAALAAAGVPVMVVPGVTAASGAAAAARMALTQRGVSQSLTLVTAMGEASDALDWRSLGAPLQTTVFYMGVAQLPRIVHHLRAHGAPAQRPALIVERATLPQQRMIAGTLADIAERAQQAGVAAPALLIVGDVAATAVKVPAALQSLGLTGLFNS